MDLIKVENLGFSYSDLNLFKNVNIEVEEGDYCVVIGNNGAGKSTIIKLLLGQLTPDQGKISVFGREVKGPLAEKKVSYVSQFLKSDFPIMVKEIMELGLRARAKEEGLSKSQRISEIEKYLEMIDGKKLIDKALQDLSGGERRKVFLAKALISKPKLLILDEPTSNLDKASRDLFHSCLRQANKEGLTIFGISHDIGPIVDDVSKFYCLENLSLIELSKEELKEELKHKHTHGGR